jgi:AraC-like DNA-binding protein
MMEDEYPKVYLYRRVIQAKHHIDQCYMNRLDLEDIADEAAFSKFHFLRLFRKIVGLTPHQYLTAVRIDKAKEMLTAGFSVSEVCLSVGFESLSSFTGLFKRMTGQTPVSFQSKMLSRQSAIQNAPLKFVPHCFALSRGWLEKSNFEEAAR